MAGSVSLSAALTHPDFIAEVRKRRPGPGKPLSSGSKRRIASACLNYAGPGRRQAIARHLYALGEPATMDTLAGAFSSDKDGQKPPWHEQLVELGRRACIGGRPMSWEEFDKPIYEGPNAPFQFARRFLGLPSMVPGDPVKAGIFEGESPERAGVLLEIREFVKHRARHGQKSDRRAAQCMVVHSEGLPRGLSALARHLQEQALELPRMEALPVCIVPCTVSTDLPHAVDRLLRFWGEEGLSDPGVMSDAEVRSGIQRIREGLARCPATIIFTGVHDPGPHFRRLKSTMLDDPFASLIQHLILPEVGFIGALNDPDIFARNRFLVLADGPCDWLAPFRASAVKLGKPAEDAAKHFIVNDGVYKDAAKVLIFHEKHKDLTLANEGVLQLADAMFSLGHSPTGVTDIAGAAKQFVEALTKSPEWLFPIAVVALTPGGLRHESLVRLAHTWRFVLALEQNLALRSQAPYLARVQLEQSDLDQFCNRFSGMFSNDDDSTLPDLTPVHPSDWLSASEDGDVIPPVLHPRKTIDFRMPIVGRAVLDAILDRGLVPPLHLRLINVLLSEESIRQHTRLMRRSAREDHSSMRENRRLLQALHHAFLSISPEDDALTPILRDIPRVFPSSGKELFRRAYAMFYRLLLEAPPEWNVSRVMSADGVKRDLLLAALASGSPDDQGVLGFRAPPRLKVPDWILKDLRNEPTTQTILHDLLHGLAQAALQVGDMEVFDRAADEAEDIIRLCGRSYLSANLADINKLRIDALILRNRLDEALQRVQAGLWDLGLSRDVVREGQRGLPTLRLSNVPIVASLLERWGEIRATQGDLLFTSENEDDRLQGSRLLDEAESILALADGCRREAFNLDPLARSYSLSGHTTRVHIRVLLLQHRKAKGDKPAVRARRHNLYQAARRKADSLTRSLVRFPAERPSMLILESIIVRMTEGPMRPTPRLYRFPAAEKKKEEEAAFREWEGLKKALDLIVEADRQMIWATDRPRLRMRLLFERAKIMRDISKAAAAPLDQQDLARRWAEHDVQLLHRLAQISGSALWVSLANRSIKGFPRPSPG